MAELKNTYKINFIAQSSDLFLHNKHYETPYIDIYIYLQLATFTERLCFYMVLSIASDHLVLLVRRSPQ